MEHHDLPSSAYSHKERSESQSSELPTSQETGQFSEFPTTQETEISALIKNAGSLSLDYPPSATVTSDTPLAPPLSGLNTAEGKKANRKRLIFRSALGALALLSVLAIAGLRLHVKFPLGLYLRDENLFLLEEVIQKLAVDPSPDCFVKHESFTSDTPDARVAQKSIEEWLNKASNWAYAAKNLPGKTPKPEDWEISILRGALVCRNIPHLETAAALSPYNPYAHGLSGKSSEHDDDTTDSVENVQPEDKERWRVKDAKEQLRHKRLEVVSWLSEVERRLAVLAEQHLKSEEEATPTDKPSMHEILLAQQFYKLLAAYAEYLAIPPDGTSLEAFDSFVAQRAASAAEAAVAIPIVDMNNPFGPLPGSDTTSSDESKIAGLSAQPSSASTSFSIDLGGVPAAVRAEGGNNRFIPAWVAQLFLAPRNTELSAPFRLRLAVESSGVPDFVKHDAEFAALVQRTIGFEEDCKKLQSLPLDSPERKHIQNRLQIMQMHSEVALAAFRIPSLEKRIKGIVLKDQENPHDLRRLTRTLSTAYDQLGAVALKWVGIVQEGKFDLTPSQTTNLTMVLRNLSNFSMLSRTLTYMHFRALVDKTFAEQNDAKIKTTAGLASISQVHIIGAARRGELCGIVPGWWANIH